MTIPSDLVVVCSEHEVIAEPVLCEHTFCYYAQKCPKCGKLFQHSWIHGLKAAEDDPLVELGFKPGFPFAPFHTLRMYRDLG